MKVCQKCGLIVEREKKFKRCPSCFHDVEFIEVSSNDQRILDATKIHRHNTVLFGARKKYGYKVI